MQPAAIININDASTTLQQVGTYASPMFTSLFPIATVPLGLEVGGLIVVAIVAAVGYAIGHMVSNWRNPPPKY